MDRKYTGVIFARVHNGFGVSERGLWIQEMIASGAKGEPFTIWSQLCHLTAENAPCVLNTGAHTRLPLIECLPRALNSPNDAFLEMSTILLHYDDALL